MKVTLYEYPSEHDWLEVKRRALVTVGLKPVSAPSAAWRRDILNARHSPIRRLHYAFLLEDVPSWVTVHLCRHIHAQPYVRSQRNDRQSMYDRNAAPQDAPVSMIWDMNAEELMTIFNKRLCSLAAAETREVVQMMAEECKLKAPEIYEFAVPMCVYHGGVCHELSSCGRCVKG